MNNNAITEIPKDLLGTEELDPKTSHEKSTSIEISDLSDDIFNIDYESLPQSQLPNLREDRQADPTTFDFQFKFDADNEEIRAKAQNGWALARNSGAQILGLGIGGMISGFGYMADLFTNLPQLIRGEEVQFNNILTQFGEGITQFSQDVAPIYQTRKAQESGWRAMGDWTWWTSNAPTLASSLAIMVPTYAVTRGISALGRIAGKSLSSATKGTSVAARLSPTLNRISESRRARGIIDHAGNTFLSRHTYNSLEANDTYQQEYLASLQKGLSEEEASKRAGQAAAAMYRIGYMNIWKDALQWRMVLGRNYASAGATGQIMTNASKSATDKRVWDSLLKRFPDGSIPRETIRRVGIGATKGKEALKTVAKMGLLEGIEEINIQHQKMLARNFIDDITGNIGQPGTGWKDVYSNLLSGYLPSLADFVYDEDSLISPEAFDAAFWAFGSGVAMGAVMRSIQPRMDNMFGGSEAAQQAKNFAQLKYFQNQMAALQKAEVEGNKPLAEKIVDDAIFSLAIGGKLDGQTHVDGALAESRLSDLQDSLRDIISSDDTTLENNGIPNSPESRRHYERMLADIDYIGERFNHHFEKTANLSDSDARALSTAYAYAEYRQKRITERLTDFRQQQSQLRSQVDTSALAEGYESLIDPSLKLKGLKHAITQIDEYISDIEKAEGEFTSDGQNKEKVIDHYTMAKSIAQNIVEQTIDEIKQIRENIETSPENDSVFKGMLETQDKLVDINEFIQTEEAELAVFKKELASLYTDKGKKKFLNERKKRISENRNKQMQAAISLATTKEQLKNFSEHIKTYSDETQQVFRDQSDIIHTRDKAVEQVEAPDVAQENQEILQEINSRVPTMSESQLNSFEQEIDALDVHGNTKNAIKKYANDVFNAAQNAIETEQNRIVLRELKKEIESEHQSLVDNIFSQPTKSEAIEVIESSNVDKGTKDILHNIVNDYYKRREDRIPDTSKKKLNDDKESKETSEGKDGSEIETDTVDIIETEDNIPSDIKNALVWWDELGDYQRTSPQFQGDKNFRTLEKAVEEGIITYELKEYRGSTYRHYKPIEKSPLPEDTTGEETQTSQPNHVTSARDQFGKNSQGAYKLDFVYRKGKIGVTNRIGEYTKNRKAGVDYHMQSSPAIKQGDPVEFVLLDNGNIAYKHNSHENPIGVIRRPNPNWNNWKSNIDSYKSEMIQFDIIKEALQSGQTVVGNIKRKHTGDDNINNITIDGKPFIRDLGHIESNQFTRKADGSIVQENRPVILMSTEGVPGTEKGARLRLNKNTYPFLDPAIIAEINEVFKDSDVKGRHGHIHAVVLSPFGEWKALNIVTRVLDTNAQNKAFEFLEKGNLESAGKIVNIRGNLNDATRRDLFLSAYHISSETNTFRIDYYDENKKRMVRLSKNTDAGSEFTVQFQDLTKPTVIKEEIEQFNFLQTKEEGFDWQDGLKKLLARKRYQVDKDRIGATDQKYTSPLTGKEYNNYYEYLTKGNVWKGKDEFGGDGKNILGSDLYSEDGSLWSNIIIEIEPTIDQSPQTPKTKPKQEYTKPEVVDKKPVQEIKPVTNISYATAPQKDSSFPTQELKSQKEGRVYHIIQDHGDGTASVIFNEGDLAASAIGQRDAYIKPVYNIKGDENARDGVFNIRPATYSKTSKGWVLTEKGSVTFERGFVEKSTIDSQTEIDSMNFLDDFSDVSDVETSRDRAISETFNQYKDTFKKGNKYLSLEEFANDVFQKELFTEEQIKKHAEAVAQDIINCKL